MLDICIQENVEMELKESTRQLNFYLCNADTVLRLPYISNGISAGFPSPAEDFLDPPIDLNKELIKNPSSTFFGRVRGESMKDVGINDGDLLVVDKSIFPTSGKIAVCFIDGEFTIKRIKKENGVFWLIPANNDYKPIQVTQENEFVIWGIVTHSIKKF